MFPQSSPVERSRGDQSRSPHVAFRPCGPTQWTRIPIQRTAAAPAFGRSGVLASYVLAAWLGVHQDALGAGSNRLTQESGAQPAGPTGSDVPPTSSPTVPSATQPTAPSRALPDAVTQHAKKSLARVLAAFAGKVLRKDELALSELELSLLLAEEATKQNPDDVNAWRAVFNTTLLSDGTDPRIEQLRSLAIERILALDPGDEVMKYRRLVEVIERGATAEERSERYAAMLTPANRQVVGDRIASRLAFKYAFLLQRMGDIEGFEQWLGESVTLDPANPEATAIAAGYFRFSVGGIAQEAELLMMAMLANPLDTLAMRGFASVLLNNGAYRGAARLLDICAQLAHTELPLMPYDELLTDVALARWGADRPSEAEELLTRRQRLLNEYFRRESGRADSSILGDPDRLASLRFPLPSGQVAVRAAILRALGKVEEWQSVLNEAFDSFDAEIERTTEAFKNDQKEGKLTPEVEAQAKSTIASLQLNAAFFAFWIGENAAKGNEFLKDAEALTTLTEVAKARFAAWTQLRSTEPAKALPMFQAIADGAPATRLGLALSHLAANDRKAAAEGLLALWRETPGTLVGVDARARLSALLGAPVPSDPTAAELEALAETIPTSFDRMFRDGAQPLSVQLIWGTHPTSVLDPIPATLEIANRTEWPLAIDDSGPIRNILCFQASVAVAGRSQLVEIPYLFHPLDRGYVIPARGVYRLPLDFGYTELGISVLRFMQPGCSISVRALVNWDTTVGGLRAGSFGDSAEADLLRIEGVRLTDEWITSVIDRAKAPASTQDLFDLVSVVNAAASASLRPEMVTDSRRVLYDRLWQELPDILIHLDVPTLCWLLFVLPDNIPPFEPALERVRTSAEPLVRLSYLVRRAAASSDPVVVAATESSDATIARYGTIVKEMLLHDEELTRRDFNLGTGRPSEGAPTLTPGEGGGASPGFQPKSDSSTQDKPVADSPPKP
jgi:hypothetical protein